MEKREVAKQLGINILKGFLVLLLLVMATRTLAISAQPQVAGGGSHTVGLKSDGTVVAVGNNAAGQCDVSSWTDIVQVATARYHTVGLKSDGTVVAVGSNSFGQCELGDWEGIVQVAAKEQHTVGLKSDGTVVAVGSNGAGQCDVSNWNLGPCSGRAEINGTWSSGFWYWNPVV